MFPSNIFKKLRSIAGSVLFIFLNLRACNKLVPISVNIYNGMVYRGAKDKQDRLEIYQLYDSFHPGKKLHWSKRLVYRFAGSKLLMTAWDDKERKLVGIDIYYFNPRDISENSVHQGFTGVHPEWQGKKIGTEIRKQALRHFAANGLSAVSSRVSLTNISSLKSNEKLGFKPEESYFDDKLGEERYYLKCDLKNFSGAKSEHYL